MLLSLDPGTYTTASPPPGSKITDGGLGSPVRGAERPAAAQRSTDRARLDVARTRAPPEHGLRHAGTWPARRASRDRRDGAPEREREPRSPGCVGRCRAAP